jgi:hypothetical protein
MKAAGIAEVPLNTIGLRELLDRIAIPYGLWRIADQRAPAAGAVGS